VPSRRAAARREGTAGAELALLIAIGIGLHNLGEGVAIGSAYAVGALALGAFLVIGFALHNTTEGLAIVAPVAEANPSLRRLAILGLVAGAFLFGFGAGAIAQVIVQLAPTLRDRAGRTLDPATVGGLLAGMAIMFATGLLVSI